MNDKEVADILERMERMIEAIAETAMKDTSYTIKGEQANDERLRRAVLADSAFTCLYDVQQELRRIDRSGEDIDIDKLREWYLDLLYENGINLEVLYT